jgi:NADPH-dependent 2,4-dienoyl-CoA reductase/sulfur reductase-like enzyme
VRLLVVGGDAAGMSAASAARRRTDPDDVEIVAFERGVHTSYSACGLPYFVAGAIDDVDELIARSPAEHRANGIEMHTHHEVVAIDVQAGAVTVRDLDAARERREAFDHLVIATGAAPVRPALPGVDAEGVYGIQSIADGIALRERLDASKPARAVVVGAGYIGLEMAEAMHQRGIDVTVIDSGPQPMSTLDPDMGALVADAMRGLGITLHTDTRAQAFERDERGHVRAIVTERETLPCDVVVLGIGVRPNVELARDAGIEIGVTGGIATTSTMATSAERVWAAGDCVQTHHRVSGRAAFVALGTHANKQGRVAGINATGGAATFRGVVGTAVTKICAYEIGRTGLTEREATEAGLDFVSATIESTTRARYFPDAQPITVKVVAERTSGRLLGGQIIGREGAAKRIDVLATALWAGLDVEEIVEVDLGYAPPFSPVWDPTLIAARRVAVLV